MYYFLVKESTEYENAINSRSRETWMNCWGHKEWDVGIHVYTQCNFLYKSLSYSLMVIYHLELFTI